MTTPIYTGIFQSDLQAAGYKITGLPTPLGSSEAATKAYVDAHAGGGGGGGTSLFTVNVKDAPYSAAGDGATDDTVAIQAAIDAVAALGGGRIYFPPGIYLVGGALRDTGARNAQLLLPNVAESAPPVTIEFLGALPPPITFVLDGVLPSATVYSTLKSTLTGASGTAACIAGAVPAGSTYSNVQLVVKDFIFQAPPDPTFSAFDCSATSPPQFYNVLLHCGNINGNVGLGYVAPTHTNATAIKLRAVDHTAGQQVIMVDIWGFYTAIQTGELATLHFNAWGVSQGVVVPASHHMSTILRMGIFGYHKGIVSDGSGTHYLRVFAYDNEHSIGAGATDRLYDLDDASNLIYGDLKFCSILTGVGNDHTFVKNGGSNFSCSDIGTDQAQTFYIGADLRLVPISGGGKLQARNTSANTWADVDQWTNP